MPKIVDHEQRREAILAAARQVFRERGITETNLQRVAARAGMSKSSLYHYFADRDALVMAAIEDAFDTEAALCQVQLAASGPVPDRMLGCLGAMLDVLAGWAEAGPLIFDFLSEERGRAHLRRLNVQIHRVLVPMIAAGQQERSIRQGDPEAMALVIVSMLNGVLLSELLEPGMSRPTQNREMFQILLRSALAEEPRPTSDSAA